MKKLILLLFAIFTVSVLQIYAQNTVTGTVTDDAGESLPGVSVLVKGTTIGTMSLADGAYSIEVPDGSNTLVFSYIGMETQEAVISGNVLDVTMKPSSEEVGEVVVTALGISRDKKALGYSVSSVNEDEIEQKGEPDLFRNLAGKVAGVNISASSGVPGSATRITIRGNSSFYGQNQPLIVVDGIPYSNDQFNSRNQGSSGGSYGTGFSTFDPADVRSINVLKGSAATALYGSRAANGVIVIETKSGNTSKVGKGLGITFKSGYSIEEISNLPEYQNTYGNGTNFTYANANGSWGPRFDSQDSIPTWPMYLEAFPDDFGDSIPYVAQPDNVKNLFQKGSIFENSLNITGGSDNSNVSLTLSNLKNNGYIPHSTFGRNSISFGGSTKLNKDFIVKGALSFSRTEQVGGFFGNNQSTDASTASSFARTLWLGRTWDMSLPYTHPVTGESLTPNGPGQFDHPLWSWEHNKITTISDRFVANLGASYDIFEFLSVSYQFGINSFRMNRDEIIDIGSRAYDGDGAFLEDNVMQTELESNLIITFEKGISDDLNLTVRAGHNLNQRETDRQSYLGTTFVTSGIFDLDNTQDVVANGGNYSQRRLWGVFTEASVGYKNYLYLNITDRIDWSSTLPVDKNWFNYPSVSTSFIFSEAFNLKSNVFTFGKIRAGWAKTANDAPAYSLYDTYDVRSGTFPFNGQPAMYTPNTTYTPDLLPEESGEIEAGLNLIFFNNRIGIDFTCYKRNSINQIVPIFVPASTGYTTLYTNAGELQNMGIEIGINLVPVDTKQGFKWEMNGTFAKNKSEVISLPEGYDRVILSGLFGDPQPVFEVGEPYGILRGTMHARDNEGNLLIDPGTGLLITADEQGKIGDPNPDFIAGLTNTLSFKGAFLSFQFSYRHGGDIWSNSIISLLGRGVTKDTEDREHSYIIPGVYGDPNTQEPLLDANGNTIPNTTQIDMNALYFGNSFAINANGEAGIYDATVLRLSQIALGYDLPKKMLDKLPFTSISISITGNNLWFFAPYVPKYTNFDPEMNTYGASNVQGVEYSAAPSVRRYGASIKLTF